MNKEINEVLIIGGGFTGLFAAIALKSFKNDLNITVIEQGKYSTLTKNFKPVILTPLVRQLLHKLPLYEQYNYHENRHLVYNLINEQYELNFKIPDTSIIYYGSYIQILLNIARTNDIEVVESTKALDYNFSEKYIVTNKEDMYYNNLIIAEGNNELTYDEEIIKIESDIRNYSFKIKDVTGPFDFRKSYDQVFNIGDFGGYKDRLIDINCSFGIISAFYAAECIANGESSFMYYDYMKDFESEIYASSNLYYNKDKIGLISNILSGEKLYSKII